MSQSLKERSRPQSGGYKSLCLSRHKPTSRVTSAEQARGRAQEKGCSDRQVQIVQGLSQARTSGFALALLRSLAGKSMFHSSHAAARAEGKGPYSGSSRSEGLGLGWPQRCRQGQAVKINKLAGDSDVPVPARDSGATTDR